jgi:hypothetical protein
LKCGRKYGSPPHIDDLPLFASRFIDWWLLVQPESRGKEWPPSRHVVPGELWERVTKGGLNGIVMVLIALTWWYRSIGDADSKQEFSVMLADVSWVVGRLTVVTKRQKRSLNEKADGPSKR